MKIKSKQSEIELTQISFLCDILKKNKIIKQRFDLENSFELINNKLVNKKKYKILLSNLFNKNYKNIFSELISFGFNLK